MRPLNHSILNKIDNHNFTVKKLVFYCVEVGKNEYVPHAQSAALTNFCTSLWYYIKLNMKQNNWEREIKGDGRGLVDRVSNFNKYV